MIDKFKNVKEYLNKYPDKLQPLINSKNFDDLYQYIYGEDNNDVLAGEFTELMFELGINPLNYMTYIPAHFASSDFLTSITIPKNIIEMSDYAFANCYKLKNITFEDDSKLTNIGFRSFLDCKNLEAITLPEQIGVINQEAFTGCKNLKSIFLPDAVERIGYGAFRNCKSLESILLPEYLDFIDNDIFEGCNNLDKIYLPKNFFKSPAEEIEFIEHVCLKPTVEIIYH